MAENGRYWQLEGENASAQMVDNVVTDLTDILHDGPPVGEDEKITIVWKEGNPTAEEGSKEARDHFELGEAGGKTIIPGEDDRLVAADGQGNAKANQGAFYSKAVNGTSQLLTPNNALELGANKASGPSYTFWGNAHDKMLAYFSGTPFFQMRSLMKSPIFSMQGTSVIEINGDNYTTITSQGNYNRKSSGLSTIANYVYRDYDSPFGAKLSSDNMLYPYLHMGQSSTLIMEGASMIKTSDGAGMELSGNATFRVNGAGCTDKYPLYATGRTFVTFHPGSFFRMASGCFYDTYDKKWKPADNSGKNHGPLFNMESSTSGGQIMLTNQWTQTTGEGDGNMDWDEFWNTVSYNQDRILSLSSGLIGNGLRNRITLRRVGSLAGRTSQVYQSTFGVQGRTNIIIGGAGTSGVLAARIATSKYTVLDWSGRGEMDIKIGEGGDSAITIDVGDGGNAKGYYKICPDGGSDTVVLFEPSSKTSINFAPNGMNELRPSGDTSDGYCGIDFTPFKTELDCRWYKLNADFQGNDAFIQTTGNFHVENHAGTFILRGSQAVATGANLRASNRAETHLGKLWQGIYASEIPAPVLQLYDRANFAMYGNATAAPLKYTTSYYLSKTDFPTEPTKQDFETTNQYENFIHNIPDSYIWNGTYYYSCESNSSYSWKVTVSYYYTYTEYITEIPAPTDSPVFEMRSISELRIRDGAYIKAQTTEGETTITFGSNSSQEEPVSFTLAELKALKNLIANT